jgi:hypothetical protein
MTTATETSYNDFLLKKSQVGGMAGFDPVFMPDCLFPFQQSLIEWATRKGRAAIFADCGLGKTLMQLVWAENVVRKTNGRVLVLTPLAVASQTEREGRKFGIEAGQSRDGKATSRITITNYERLHLFNPHDFVGVVCDESSAIKAMNGKRREEVTEFMRIIRHRLLCTATAAPNDYVELGTSSEALGEMGQRDMITMFFKQETSADYLGWGRTKYRMKGHAEHSFWRWVCSWARACRKPSDLGFDDNGFNLPPMTETEHVVKARTQAPGMLFEMAARDMHEERAERRRTIVERCERAAELVKHNQPAVIWCHLNDEGDLLEKMIPDAVQISGSDDDEKKVETYDGFSSGKVRVLVIKPKIGAWGLNWQHCNHVVTFASHSYEQYYQAVRRCWRFGQARPVNVDIVVTEGEQRVAENLERKAEAASKMFTAMVRYMNQSISVNKSLNLIHQERIPSWLSSTKPSPTATHSITATAVR